jgi:regulator of protease activity HflC (stomatin/prohibitin superfamily)
MSKKWSMRFWKAGIIAALAYAGYTVLNYLLNQDSDVAMYLGFGLFGCMLYVGLDLLARVVSKVFWKKDDEDDRGGKMLALACLVLAASTSSTGCYTIVPPGNVGIRVEQTGGNRGVQDIPLSTGRVFYNPFNENVLTYPTSVQQYTWTKDTNEEKPQNEEMCFKSSDFMLFCADVNAAFSLVDAKVPAFYKKFNNDDINAFVHGFFKNVVRDSFTAHAPEYTSDQLNGAKQDDLLKQVAASAHKELEPLGVELIKLGFAHPPRAPEEIQKAVNRKVQAIQDAIRVENELRMTEAEAKKRIAEAEGKAKSNQVEMQSITPQLIQMRTIERWDGHLAPGTNSFLQVQGLK